MKKFQGASLKKILFPVAVAGLILVSGCGTQNNATITPAVNSNTTVVQKSSNGQRTMIVGGEAYAGTVNLQKYEAAAKSSPKDAQAQIHAGMSAFVNQDYQSAIQYYKQAIQDTPNDAIPYNNVGNIYYRKLNQPKEALAYYQKATQLQPSYAYGWLNLALCEQTLGNMPAAQQAVKDGLQNVAKTDPVYKSLQTVLKSK